MIEQLMETAPRDGTRILLKILGTWAEGRWEIPPPGYDPYWDYFFFTVEDEQPTAWAPLPKLPQLGKIDSWIFQTPYRISELKK